MSAKRVDYRHMHIVGAEENCRQDDARGVRSDILACDVTMHQQARVFFIGVAPEMRSPFTHIIHARLIVRFWIHPIELIWLIITANSVSGERGFSTHSHAVCGCHVFRRHRNREVKIANQLSVLLAFVVRLLATAPTCSSDD